MTLCGNSTVDGDLHLFLCREYVATRLAFAGVVAAVGFCLNVLMLLLIYFNESSLTAQNRLVLNLCCNNIVFCVYVLPVYIYDLVRGLDNDWGIYCELQGFFFMFNQCNVILAYLHITLHRYFTIVFPNSTVLGYGSARKTWVIVAISSALLALVMSVGLLGIWGRYGQSWTSGVCTLLSDKQGGSGNYKLFGYLVAILFPLVAMAYCYGHILYIVRRHKNRFTRGTKAPLTPSLSITSQSDSIRSKFKSRETYVTVLSVSVVAVFALSYIPYLLAQHVNFLQNWILFQAVSGALSYVHALTDPLIYVLGDSTLRKQLRRLFQDSKCNEEDEEDKDGRKNNDQEEVVLEEMDNGPLLESNHVLKSNNVRS